MNIRKRRYLSYLAVVDPDQVSAEESKRVATPDKTVFKDVRELVCYKACDSL